MPKRKRAILSPQILHDLWLKEDLASISRLVIEYQADPKGYRTEELLLEDLPYLLACGYSLDFVAFVDWHFQSMRGMESIRLGDLPLANFLMKRGWPQKGLVSVDDTGKVSYLLEYPGPAWWGTPGRDRFHELLRKSLLEDLGPGFLCGRIFEFAQWDRPDLCRHVLTDVWPEIETAVVRTHIAIQGTGDEDFCTTVDLRMMRMAISLARVYTEVTLDNPPDTRPLLERADELLREFLALQSEGGLCEIASFYFAICERAGRIPEAACLRFCEMFTVDALEYRPFRKLIVERGIESRPYDPPPGFSAESIHAAYREIVGPPDPAFEWLNG